MWYGNLHDTHCVAYSVVRTTLESMCKTLELRHTNIRINQHKSEHMTSLQAIKYKQGQRNKEQLDTPKGVCLAADQM